MKQDAHFLEALAELRSTIRQSGKQFRRAEDNSGSLFHPREGFTYAYDIMNVEQALDTFEASIGTALDKDAPPNPFNELLKEAKVISQVHPSKDARHFARSVLSLMSDLHASNPPPADVTPITRQSESH